jgi:molybdopterin-guanine dinucleotide biosynthesis adapter protein
MSEIVAIVGRSGVGKTTLVERVLPLLKAKGLKVATIKHTHHKVHEDRRGSDTFRHRESGADGTLLSGPGFCTVWSDQEMDPLVLAQFMGVGRDLVLIEGYKSSPFRRIEVVRGQEPVLAAEDSWLTVTSDEAELVLSALLGLLGHNIA